MTSWDSITADMIRDELAGFTAEAGMGPEEGWLTLDELAERYGVSRHRMSTWVMGQIKVGKMLEGQRPACRIDGRRILKKVYRPTEESKAPRD